MEEPRGLSAARALIRKGVNIPNPWTVDVGHEVSLDRISGNHVTIHPGCRIRGQHTVIGPGCEIGREGPVTMINCRLGTGVSLHGGFATDSVFLDGASLGLGHHVRAGTLMEEQSSGAHNVGLKQTILMPFVTLGSLINFCDVLMAGGTSRSDHSEVGSSYIHFNFTPTGDKTTASLFGDVPRGVLLRQRPIFLGGQGGTVGPVQVAYGSVIGAGSILRDDVAEENQLVVTGGRSDIRKPFRGNEYRDLDRILARNVVYLANLDALDEWYRTVRRPFFAAQEFGFLLCDGALEMIASARGERLSRLAKLAGKLPGSNPSQLDLKNRIQDLAEVFGKQSVEPEWFLINDLEAEVNAGVGYLSAIGNLTAEDADSATRWLQAIVDAQCSRATRILPSIAAQLRP